MAGFSWGGSEDLWSKTALLASKEGFEVKINLFDWQPRSSEVNKLLSEKDISVSFRPLSPSYSITNRILSRVGLHKLGQIKWENYIDANTNLLVINQGGTYDICWHPDLREFVEKRKIPFVIISQHNFEFEVIPKEWRQVAKDFFPLAKKIFFVSKRNKDVAELQTLSKFHNSEVIANPIKFEGIDVMPMPELKDGKLKLAHIARLDSNVKGQHFLLKALASEKVINSNWELSFVGEGKDEEFLKELTNYLGLSHKVFFLGKQNVLNVWQDHHVLILPSFSEGTPLTLLEAMKIGRPCIATDVGGVTEWLDDKVNGLIINHTENSIVEAINYFISNTDHLIEMAIQASTKINQCYPKSPMKNLLTSLEACINQK